MSLPNRTVGYNKGKYDISSTSNSTKATSEIEVLEHLSYYSIESTPFEVETTLKLPSYTLQPGETIRLTVQKLTPEDRTTTKQSETPINKKEVLYMNSSVTFNLKMINNILNFAVIAFLSSSFIFIILFAFNLFITRQDSIFGFFLTMIVGLLFGADKAYRRNLNAKQTKISN